MWYARLWSVRSHLASREHLYELPQTPGQIGASNRCIPLRWFSGQLKMVTQCSRKQAQWHGKVDGFAQLVERCIVRPAFQVYVAQVSPDQRITMLLKHDRQTAERVRDPHK